MEKPVREELAHLAADLRGWLEVQGSHFAAFAEEALPAPSDEATGPVALQSEGTGGAAPDPASLTPRPEEGLKTPAADGGAKDAEVPPRGEDQIRPAEPATPDAHDGRVLWTSGNPQADIVFVGQTAPLVEGTGADPFSGQAGEMLTKIINNVLQLDRPEVYLLAAVAPPAAGGGSANARDRSACAERLRHEVDSLQAAVVVGLGLFASQALLQTEQSLIDLRGRVHPFGDACLVPTYDPAYLLSNPGEKRKVFEDMKLVRIELEQRTGRTLAPIGRAREAQQ